MVLQLEGFDFVNYVISIPGLPYDSLIYSQLYFSHQFQGVSSPSSETNFLLRIWKINSYHFCGGTIFYGNFVVVDFVTNEEVLNVNALGSFCTRSFSMFFHSNCTNVVLVRCYIWFSYPEQLQIASSIESCTIWFINSYQLCFCWTFGIYFCLLETPIMAACPFDIKALVWSFVSWCTAKAASTYQ